MSAQTLAYDPIITWMQRSRATQVAHLRAAELWQARQEALVAQVSAIIELSKHIMGSTCQTSNDCVCVESGTGNLSYISIRVCKQLVPYQELLLPAALRSARSQQQSKGLVVLCATYGSQPPDAGYVPSYQPSTPRGVEAEEPASQPPPPWMDVTVPLQYAVSNCQLALPSGVRLMHRMGFYDPCPEAQKSLNVECMYRCVCCARDGAVAWRVLHD